MKRQGINQIFTSPYNPTGNSISERVNANIVTVLRIYKRCSIKHLKQLIENRINNLVHSALKMTPNCVH